MENYIETIFKAIENGNLKTSDGVLTVGVAHDKWCKIYENKSCNCNTEISVETNDGLVSLNKDGSIRQII
jgi:hypothetical protein